MLTPNSIREALVSSGGLQSGGVVDPWLADPLPFLEFAGHPDHMNFPPLSDRQRQWCGALLPSDPKLTFSPEARSYDIGVALFGKGGSKDTLASLITGFSVYVLLNLRRPYEFLRKQHVEGEPIDILIVAPRGRTAQKVTFEKIKQRVLNWKWLRASYSVRVSGREVSAAERIVTDQDTVEIGASTIVFPHNIRIFALNSAAETAEGYNILTFVATEFAAFTNSDDKPNADKIYSILHSSANTRFPGRFLGLLLSYPRYSGDAIMKKYEEAQSDPRMFAMKAATWEVNPTCQRKDYEAQLNHPNPLVRRDALAKYMCEPSPPEALAVEYPERVEACIQDRPPIADLEPVEETLNGARMRQMRIARYNIPRQPDSKKYVARVDLGRTHDRAALCVGHLEGSLVVIDLLVHWIPDSQHGLVIDIDDPARVIEQLRRERIYINYCSYDSWNSSSSITRLNRSNIVSDVLSLRPEDYALFLDHLYSRSVSLYKFHALTDRHDGELFHLVRDTKTGKVDHLEGWHNDLTEAVCGVVAMLKGLRKNVADIAQGLSNVQPNLQNVSSNVWADEPSGKDVGPFTEGDDGIYPGEAVPFRY